MNPKKPNNKGPRPGPKSGNKPSKHYWYRRCYPWYDWDDWDYDWDDYDYDPTDWDFYSAPRRVRADQTVVDPVAEAYQQGYKDGWTAAYGQGYKDGWAAAMEYSYYGENKPEPPMPPAPVSPTETPTQ